MTRDEITRAVVRGKQAMTRTRYYVGLTTQHGRPVSQVARDSLTATVAAHYGGGCTIYQAVGYWKGAREESQVYEVLGEMQGTPFQPELLAAHLASVADQSSVLWTCEEVQGGFEP